MQKMEEVGKRVRQNEGTNAENSDEASSSTGQGPQTGPAAERDEQPLETSAKKIRQQGAHSAQSGGGGGGKDASHVSANAQTSEPSSSAVSEPDYKMLYLKEIEKNKHLLQWILQLQSQLRNQMLDVCHPVASSPAAGIQQGVSPFPVSGWWSELEADVVFLALVQVPGRPKPRRQIEKERTTARKARPTPRPPRLSPAPRQQSLSSSHSNPRSRKQKQANRLEQTEAPRTRELTLQGVQRRLHLLRGAARTRRLTKGHPQISDPCLKFLWSTTSATPRLPHPNFFTSSSF